MRDRFRYGLPEEMPLYRHHASLENGTLLVAGWLTDPKIKGLTHTSSSFPAQFITTIELEDADEICGMTERYDGHAVLELVVFTDEAERDAWQWKSHFITDKCTACTICERVCPTNAISGGEIFYIDPDLCINCSVCGVYCPFDAITDNENVTVQRIKAKQIPKAEVHEHLCTGCEFCVDVCPFEALVMEPVDKENYDPDYPLPQTGMVATVIPKNCVSCKLCEQVCIKDAVVVPRPAPVRGHRDELHELRDRRPLGRSTPTTSRAPTHSLRRGPTRSLARAPALSTRSPNGSTQNRTTWKGSSPASLRV